MIVSDRRGPAEGGSLISRCYLQLDRVPGRAQPARRRAAEFRQRCVGPALRVAPGQTAGSNPVTGQKMTRSAEPAPGSAQGPLWTSCYQSCPQILWMFVQSGDHARRGRLVQTLFCNFRAKAY